MLAAVIGGLVLSFAAPADDPTLDRIRREDAQRATEKQKNDALLDRERREREDKERQQREGRLREGGLWRQEEERKHEQERQEEFQRQQHLGESAKIEEERRKEHQASLYKEAAAALAEVDSAIAFADERGASNRLPPEEFFDLPDGYYESGPPTSVRDHYTRALRLLKLWADKDCSEAQYRLGILYSSGRLGERSAFHVNLSTAAEWFRKAAISGHYEAQLKLGEAYAQGAGVPQDFAEAKKWFTLAADHGGIKARVALGRLYQAGQGGRKDPEIANMWFMLALMTRDGPWGGWSGPRTYEWVELRATGATPKDLLGNLSAAERAAAFALLADAMNKGMLGVGRDANRSYILGALAAQIDGSGKYDAVRDMAAQKLSIGDLALDHYALAQSWLLGTVHDDNRGYDIPIDRRNDLYLSWLESAARLGHMESAMEAAENLEYARNGAAQDLAAAYGWYAIAASLVPGGKPYHLTEWALNRVGPQLKKEELARTEYRVGRFFESELKNPRPDLAAKWYSLAKQDGYAGGRQPHKNH